MTNPNLANVNVPFRWSIADGLNGMSLLARSYSSEIEAVLARTSTKWVSDKNGILVPQVHSLPPVGWFAGQPALLLEPAGTNLCIRSQEFDTWTDLGGVTVSADAVPAPDRTVTADLLTASTTSAARLRDSTFTGDGTKAFSVFLKYGSSLYQRLHVRDFTASVNRHIVQVLWVAGVPTLSTVLGSGTLFEPEALGNGWYRVAFSADGIVAANSNQFRIYPDATGGVGTNGTYVWGAQTENAAVPSSYMPTAASTVTRSADSLYFPFTAAPQEMTVYARTVERGYRYSAVTPRFVHFGAGSSAEPRFLLYTTPGGNVATYHHNNVDSAVTASVGASARVLGDVLEARGVLYGDGSVRVGQSINGAVEATSAQSSAPASGLAAAFAGQRLYLNGFGVTECVAFTHVVVALGEQTMDTMRELAGV